MDLLTRIELEVRAKMAPHVAPIVIEELRPRLPSMTLGELHAFLSTEVGRRAFHVPIAEIVSPPAPTIEEAATASTQGIEDPPGEGLTWKEATQRFQASHFRKTLVECDWSITQVARRLDLARSAVYAMIDRFGVDYHRGQTPSPPPEGPESED